MKPKTIKKYMTVKQIGDSYYLHIDKDMRKILLLTEGAIVGAKIWNVFVKQTKCPQCKYEFQVLEQEDPHDCPMCGKEFIDAEAIDIPEPTEKEYEAMGYNNLEKDKSDEKSHIKKRKNITEDKKNERRNNIR